MLTSIQDLIGENIIDLYNAQNISLGSILFNIITVFLLSLIILFVYKKSYQTTVYNKSFAMSLPITSMVTSIIIISVSSNIILSLGMVGALSIVRFRTAIKNPYDTVFMFWSVGLGITVGANLIIVALLSTIAIGIAILLLTSLELLADSYFLIIRIENKEFEQEVYDKISEIYKKYSLKNKTVKNKSVDLTLEVRSRYETHRQKKSFKETIQSIFKPSKQPNKELLINQIADIESVSSVCLLSHNGDYISE